MTTSPYRTSAPEIRRWPTEQPLFVVCILVAIIVWLLLIVSVIGIIYAVFLGAFFFVAHVLLIAHVRGSAVKLGPAQFPELHQAVARLAARVSLDPLPDAYVMQAGGALNAFATKLFGTNLVVLYADLLDACGNNTAARDMIIAHELGHVKCGHLRFQWFLLPALFVPFLGTALSRAREYTCDRFGMAGAGDMDGGLLGLQILAVGAKRGPLVNRRAMLEQAKDINKGWMTIAQWLGTHPPLVKRLAALDPVLAPQGVLVAEGQARAVLIIAGVFGLFIGGSVLATKALVPMFEEINRQAEVARSGAPLRLEAPHVVPANAAEIVQSDFARILEFLTSEIARGANVPEDGSAFADRWRERHGGAEPPEDPYDGYAYGYNLVGAEVRVVSSGPDGEAGSADDIVLHSPLRRRD